MLAFKSLFTRGIWRRSRARNSAKNHPAIKKGSIVKRKATRYRNYFFTQKIKIISYRGYFVTWLSLSSGFCSTHMWGRWILLSFTNNWKPSLRLFSPSANVMQAFAAVLWKNRDKNFSQILITWSKYSWFHRTFLTENYTKAYLSFTVSDKGVLHVRWNDWA